MLAEGGGDLPTRLDHVKEIGRQMTERGEYPAAVGWYNEVIKTNGRDVGLLNDYARALIGAGGSENVQQAVGLLRTAVGIDRESKTRNADTYVGLGMAYGRAAEYTSSLKFYRTAQEINSEHDDVQFLNGTAVPDQTPAAEREAAEREAALARRASAEKLQKDGLTILRERQRPPHEATILFERAIALVGERMAPWCVFERGRYLYSGTDPQQGEVDIRTAARLMPDHTTVQQTFRQLGGQAPR